MWLVPRQLALTELDVHHGIHCGSISNREETERSQIPKDTRSMSLITNSVDRRKIITPLITLNLMTELSLLFLLPTRKTK